MRICWDWKSIIGKIQSHKVTKLWSCKVTELQIQEVANSQSCNVAMNLQSHESHEVAM